MVSTRLSAAPAACAQFTTTIESNHLDLAPPAGYVEICAQHAELCKALTAGYPASAKTLAYFVSSADWEAFKRAPTGFKHYLIAQQATTVSPNGFSKLKEEIRSRQGAIPDHSALPDPAKSTREVVIPVFIDTDDAISFGKVMSIRPVTPTPLAEIRLASTNTALKVKGVVLSLYAFTDMSTDRDVETAKELTRTWLGCIRSANKR
jgi:hypothetical protein